MPQLAIRKLSEPSQTQWEECREQIFQLYIAEKKTLKEVMAIIKRDRGLNASPKVYKTKIAQWSFSKNNRRSEILAILRLKEERESIGKESDFTLRDRTVDLKNVERYQKRNRIYDVSKKPVWGELQPYPRDLICKTPPQPQKPLSLPQLWRVPEKLLYEVDVYIKGSFESGAWSFNGNEFLIESSKFQASDKHSLQTFVGWLDTGCTNFAAGNAEIAGLHWRSAFREIEKLVKCSYHDTIPNIIQKLNDLNDQGYRRLAILMKEHIARSSRVLESPGHARGSIFRMFEDMDLDQMVGLEEMIMGRFVELFELYFGSQCYNSFVLVMNLAKRKLERNKWTTFDECLPNVSVLDEIFGPSNRRPLDVLRLHATILYEREMYQEAENEGFSIIQRAQVIQNDEWQRLYFLINGWYVVGSSQYSLGEYAAAATSFLTTLALEEEFGKTGFGYLFNPEKVIMFERLEGLATMSNSHHEAAEWHSQRMRMFQNLKAVDSS